MEPLIFIIAILGCGEGDAPCDELRIAPGRYESQAACVRATEPMLARHADQPYPVVVAQCRPASGAFDPPSAGEIELPAPETNPFYPVR